MFKKILSFVLVVLLLNVLGVGSAYAGSKEEKEARFTEQVREGVRKLGTGTEARVEVKLRDKTKLKGYVSQSNTESFTVVDASGTGRRERAINPHKKLFTNVSIEIISFGITF